MRIVVDLQAIQSPNNRGRGIGRAYRSLVREIIQQRGKHEVLVVISGVIYDYADEIWAQLSDILPIDCFYVWHGIAEASWHQSTQNETLAYYRQINTILYQALLADLHPDVVLFGNFCDGYHDSCLLPVLDDTYPFPVVMICHDLIPLVYPTLYDDRSGSGFIDFYRLQLTHLKKADHILAFSKSVEQDIIRFLDYPAHSVTMTSMGYTPLDGGSLTISEVEDVCHKYNIKKPFLLYVSAQDPRKNHVGVIEAFSRLDPTLRDNYQIVFAGSNFGNQDRLYAALDDFDLPRSILSLAIHPTDSDLRVIYRLAHLGIFASLYEGFGLGILESMAYGLPVIASNTSAMPEVMGRDDALFDPFEPDSMTAKIAQGLTDEPFRADLIRFGFERVEQHDWAKCGIRAVRALEEMHSRAPDHGGLPEGFSAKQWAIARVRSLPLPSSSLRDVETILANVATAVELTYPSPVRPNNPRILIDVSEFVHYDYNTGIQRVIKCVVIEMARQLKDIELVLVYSHADGIGYFYATKLQEHLLNGKPRVAFEHELAERVAFTKSDILFHSELTMQAVVRQRFYLQALRRIGVKTMFLVYDLIPITHPMYHVGHTKKAMLSWLSCLLQSDKIISISKATEDVIRDCVTEYKLAYQPNLELQWFHLGGDFHNYLHPDTVSSSKNSSRVLAIFRAKQIEYLKGKTNFLTVGTIEPRKSHIDMLKTIELLWQHGSDVNLVIVGKVGWLDEESLKYLQNHRELGQHLFLFSNLTDAQLNEIYDLASCLLYFSKVEGFGLPLVEAAQHDLPIIVRDAPVFREVCGDHAFYFPDDLNAAEIAPYIEKWLSLYRVGQHPKSTNLPWLTWKDSVRALMIEIFSKQNPSKRLIASGADAQRPAVVEVEETFCA